MTVRFVPPEDDPKDTGLCDRNLNFLAHAQCIELDIGSRCGGHGVCGGDRIRFEARDLANLSPVTQAEREHLTEAELEAGWRLACQVYPERSDLAMDVAFTIC